MRQSEPENVIADSPSVFPKSIWFIRHGESLGNVARQAAEAASAKSIEIHTREPDIPLSESGITQSVKTGKWLAASSFVPDVVYSSPYLRTSESTRLILEQFETTTPDVRFDERLRERELGVFDRLTKRGAAEKYPDLCELREHWGKFYFRPPGGESWTDVIIRLRSFINTECRLLKNKDVLVVTHEVVIRCFKYILEDLNEQQIISIDGSCDVMNGAVTNYEFCPLRGNLTLNFDNHLPE